ncbi:hypothetical protein GCM10009743_23440 [Kribbella swartbergensis]
MADPRSDGARSSRVRDDPETSGALGVYLRHLVERYFNRVRTYVNENWSGEWQHAVALSDWRDLRLTAEQLHALNEESARVIDRYARIDSSDAAAERVIVQLQSFPRRNSSDDDELDSGAHAPQRGDSQSSTAASRLPTALDRRNRQPVRNCNLGRRHSTRPAFSSKAIAVLPRPILIPLVAFGSAVTSASSHASILHLTIRLCRESSRPIAFVLRGMVAAAGGLIARWPLTTASRPVRPSTDPGLGAIEEQR